MPQVAAGLAELAPGLHQTTFKIVSEYDIAQRATEVLITLRVSDLTRNTRRLGEIADPLDDEVRDFLADTLGMRKE